MSLIEDFVFLLRQNGLDMPVSELIDAQKSYEILGMSNREELKAGLRSCLVKDPNEINTFNLCFDAFFSELKSHQRDLDAEHHLPTDSLETPGAEVPRNFRFERSMLRWLRNENRPIGNLILEGDVQGAAQAITQMVLQVGGGPSSVRGAATRFNQIESDFLRTIRMTVDRRLHQGSRQSSEDALLVEFQTQTMKALNFARRSIVDQADFETDELLEAFTYSLEEKSRRDAPMRVVDLNLSELRLSLEEVQKELTKLGKKLASKERRRRRMARKKGRVDFRRTIRKSLQFGGSPLILARKKKRIEDPEIILLNDISGSTEWASEWFFVVALSARKTFRKIRIFEFDSTIAEITKALDSPTLSQALKKRGKMWEAPFGPRGVHSNYETSFQHFCHAIKESGGLSRRKSIIILGDCRDYQGTWHQRGVPRSQDYISKMVKRSKRVLVLNPEAPRLWDTGDSVVSHYRDVGAEIYHVDNLRRLARTVYDVS